MESEGLKESRTRTARPSDAKAYNRIKLALGIASSALSLALIVVLVATGLTRTLAGWSASVAGSEYPALILFAVCLGALQSVLTLPLGWYSSFVIEHRFGLSNQSFMRWVWEHVKGLLVAAPLLAGILCIFYYCLRAYGSWWWLPLGIAVTLISVVLARVAPVLIMPIFYRFTPIGDGSLKDRILRLCAEAGVHIEGIFSFDLSKNTKKANAAFTGIGKAKRIILGDTLVRDFSEEEIETVFAHELGHYRFGHIRKGIAAGIVSTFAGMFVASQLYAWSVAEFGFSGLADLGALPLLAIWLTLFGLVTSPIGNMISRRHERQADAYAVKSTGKRDAFVSALRKLGTMNLADPAPHPLVEFFFYSHPPIAKRIRAVESGQG